MRTKHKIAIARLASGLVRCGRRLLGRGPEGVFRRRGVNWRLDLREGIDFSIYLLGCFEPATVRAYHRHLQAGQVAIDIGANVGAHTLHLARLVGPGGKVVAFEPTDFACAKLRANLALNPQLAGTVICEQAFLSASSAGIAPAEIYASWPLVRATGLHGQHFGQAVNSSAARVRTLDQALDELAIGHVDFIKLDVDGNEPGVLAGARRILERDRPMLLMELSPDLFADRPGEFDRTVAGLAELGYVFLDERNESPIADHWSRLAESVGPGASRNAIVCVRPSVPAAGTA